jgi:hypothetical protein
MRASVHQTNTTPLLAREPPPASYFAPGMSKRTAPHNLLPRLLDRQVQKWVETGDKDESPPQDGA